MACLHNERAGFIDVLKRVMHEINILHGEREKEERQPLLPNLLGYLLRPSLAISAL